MASLNRDEVERIASLARLALSEEEIERFAPQLSAILEHVQQLNALDLSGIAPTSSVLPPRSRLREDQPLKGLDRDETLANAPRSQDGQFRVPPVLE